LTFDSNAFILKWIAYFLVTTKISSSSRLKNFSERA
jgi:maltodextrin utilization protein YvdJ